MPRKPIKRPSRPATKTPWRNQSPSGWWIASYIERLEFVDENRSDPTRRCLAWKNTILLRARDRDAAYGKALRLARAGHSARFSRRTSPNGRPARWVVDGLTELLPIYEELADGAEVLWTEYRRRSVASIQSLVRGKGELPVFRDDRGA